MSWRRGPCAAAVLRMGQLPCLQGCAWPGTSSFVMSQMPTRAWCAHQHFVLEAARVGHLGAGQLLRLPGVHLSQGRKEAIRQLALVHCVSGEVLISCGPNHATLYACEKAAASASSSVLAACSRRVHHSPTSNRPRRLTILCEQDGDEGVDGEAAGDGLVTGKRERGRSGQESSLGFGFRKRAGSVLQVGERKTPAAPLS